jgi:hypothetical protein
VAVLSGDAELMTLSRERTLFSFDLLVCLTMERYFVSQFAKTLCVTTVIKIEVAGSRLSRMTRCICEKNVSQPIFSSKLIHKILQW